MDQKILLVNKDVAREFDVFDCLEAGVELKGAEVKSIREKRTSLKGSFCRIEGGEAYIYEWTVSPYRYATSFQPDSTRPRRLLLKKREIRRLIGKVAQKGFTLVPTKIYLKGNRVKLEIALVKGKRRYDKREELKRKTEEREAKRVLKKGIKMRF
jgi:SsrA-binding protein